MSIDVDTCYRRHGPMVFRRCRALLGDDRAAEDAMQDVFVQLFLHREELDDRAMSGLLYQIATHVSLNHLRSRRRRPENPEEALLMAIADSEDVEATTGIRRLLGALFGHTEAKTRVLATLHYVEGWTLEEVARESGLSVSGVRKRLRALKAQLANLEKTP